MTYVKIFPKIAIEDAEETLNDFFDEVDRKAHRVMHTRYELRGDFIQAIITLSGQRVPYRRAAFEGL